MPTDPGPAAPEQIRLLIGLSSLTIVPLVGLVMLYFTSHVTPAEQVPAWRAFAIALATGACLGLAWVRYVPLFGGSLPQIPSVRTVLMILPVIALTVVIAVGRLAHQGVPATMGFIVGNDAVLATVLLLRSLRSLSEITPPR